MSDRDLVGLRGPVASCVQIDTHSNGAPVVTTDEYSRDGRGLSRRLEQSGKLMWQMTRQYDDRGRLLEITSANDGQAPARRIYSYDDAGRLKAIVNTRGDQTTFAYDELNRKTSTQTFTPEALERTRNVAFAGPPWLAAESGFRVPLGGSVATRYNGSDQAIELIVLDRDGGTVSRVERTYGDAGRVLSEKALTENPASLFVERMSEEQRAQLDDAQLAALNKGMRTLHAQMGTAEVSYVYDTEGKLVESRRGTELFYNRSEFRYNEYGDKTEERTTHVRAGSIPFGVVYSIDETGDLIPKDPPSDALPSSPPEVQPPVVTTYAYEYDRHGNWVVLAETQRAEGAENTVVTRTRELTYSCCYCLVEPIPFVAEFGQDGTKVVWHAGDYKLVVRETSRATIREWIARI